tara:strand:+ start:98 stop:751 length:654 start_codon:yes stop_codon:yes gene_type:complete
MSIKNYIKSKKHSNFFVSGIEILINDLPPKNIDVKKTVEILIKIIPSKLLRNIKRILVGQHEELRRREIQAFYKDSSIYITNQQESTEDMLDDLVHEVAHSLEGKYVTALYDGNEMKREFLSKRKRLWRIISKNRINLSLEDYLQADYNPRFDEFLYKEVGYNLLSSLTAGLFYSPYAATSLEEYFANGFEAFYLRRDLPRLKSISPVLYNKILQLQ